MVDRLIWKDLGWVKVMKASPAWFAPCQCHTEAAKPLQAHGPNPNVVGQGVSWPCKTWGSTEPLSEMNRVHAPRLSPVFIQERACPFLYGGQFQTAAHLLCPTKHSTSFFQASQKRKAFLLCTVVCRGLAGVQNHHIYLWGFQLTPVPGKRRPRPLAQASPGLQAQLVVAVSVLLNIKGCCLLSNIKGCSTNHPIKASNPNIITHTATSFKSKR